MYGHFYNDWYHYDMPISCRVCQKKMSTGANKTTPYTGWYVLDAFDVKAEEIYCPPCWIEIGGKDGATRIKQASG